MGFYRIVNTDFWIDPKVVDYFSKEDKYFWLYLLTNPLVRQLGIYNLPKKMMSFQTGYDTQSIDELLNKFEDEYKMIIYSEETQEIAILNYLKYSIVSGGKPVIDCINKDIKLVKNKSLIKAVYNKAINFNDNRETIDTIINLLQEDIEIENYVDRNNENDNKNDTDNDNDNDSIVSRIGTRNAYFKERNKEYLNFFDTFWLAYPRKEGKAKAQKIWLDLKPDEHLTLQILKGIERHRESKQWQEEKYIPKPDNFLNDKRWEDEVEVVEPYEI